LGTKEREKQLALPQPVPVYITYLTAVPDKSSIHFIDDVYRRDPPKYEPSGT
jgi:L,D-transpeptidase YcbB